MDQKERLALREQIASGINHGLNNLEIYGTLGKKDESVSPADLIGVIRDMMTEQKTTDNCQ
jgi:hypothetical protein